MGGFVEFTESDLGSKGRAKKACRDFPTRITKEGKWRLKAWWQRVLTTAQMLCMGWAFDTGTLWGSIRIEENKQYDEGFPYEVVFGSKNEMINSQIVAGGTDYLNPKTGRVCDYAQAVHDGHFTRSGRWIPEKPFLRMAIEMHRAELDKILQECITIGEKQEWVGD